MIIPNSYAIESLEEEFFIHSRADAAEEEEQAGMEAKLPRWGTQAG